MASQSRMGTARVSRCVIRLDSRAKARAEGAAPMPRAPAANRRPSRADPHVARALDLAQQLCRAQRARPNEALEAAQPRDAEHGSKVALELGREIGAVLACPLPGKDDREASHPRGAPSAPLGCSGSTSRIPWVPIEGLPRLDRLRARTDASLPLGGWLPAARSPCEHVRRAPRVARRAGRGNEMWTPDAERLLQADEGSRVGNRATIANETWRPKTRCAAPARVPHQDVS